MTAAERLAALDGLAPAELVRRTQAALAEFVDVMSRETTALRAGRFPEASGLAAPKARSAEDYVTLARAVQRALPRIETVAAGELAGLRAGHEKLATQLAENLRVLATARSVTEDLLGDAARKAGQNNAPQTYGAGGQMPKDKATQLRGISVNRSL
ncbi:MAG TPA: hypothetical protein VIL84_14215 [Devosiaceae bacterium]